MTEETTLTAGVAEARSGDLRATIARQLAEFSSRIVVDDVPTLVRDHAKLHLADALACAIGAADAPPTRAARVVASDLAPGGACTMIGSTQRTSADMAAFVNGVAVRYLDFCDVFLGLEITPPAANTPAVLAAGEQVGATGVDCLVGLIVTYETLLRLCSSVSLRAAGWDTVEFGAIASAVGAARMRRLDIEATEHAIAMAAVASSGLLQARTGQLSMWKAAASANATRHGVFAAFLAGAGMTGPAEIFEGERGLARSVTGPFELAQLGWRTPQVLFKRHPAQILTQTAIDAALALHRRIDPDAIADVTVHTFRQAIEMAAPGPAAWNPTTRETADHSLPFVVAAALRDGALSPAAFNDAAMAEPGLRHVMRRVSVVEDPAYTARFGADNPCRVDVRSMSGRVTSEEACEPGAASLAALRARVEEKFMALARPPLGSSGARRLFEAALNLEHLDNLAPLLHPLAGIGERA